jgi:anti-sigma-K factor RskA
MPLVSGAWTLPSDPAERDALAGEYVLGTLDARLCARIAAAVQEDPGWRDAVAGWETRLAPLGNLARPEAPPSDTWERIEARIVPTRAKGTRRQIRLGWIWRVWALGATAAAAVLGYLVSTANPPQQSRLMTVLIPDRNTPALFAEIDPRGGLRLNTVAAVTGRQLQAPSGRVMQVWGLPPGATAPVSLGLMPHEPGKVTTLSGPPVRPVAGMIIEISLEPEGGSPTGKPTGPVVFFGRLSEAGPDT